MPFPHSIEHLFPGGATQILQDWHPNLDPTGFDTATLRVDFRGSVNDLITAYAKGSQAAGQQMYVTGIQAIEDQRFGWVTATIGAKGFWGEAPLEIESYEVNTTETRYPITGGSSVYSGNFNIVFSPAPGKTGSEITINPRTDAPWRVRAFNQGTSMTREGVSIGDAGQIPPLPTGPTTDLPESLRGAAPYAANNTGYPDPLLTVGINGQGGKWIRMNYTTTGTQRIGAKVFRTWTDRWEWINGNSY